MKNTVPFPLHPAQRDIYTDQLIDVASAQYNIGGYLILKGNLNKEKFHEAVDSAPRVFDAFKIRFDLRESTPFCYFEDDYDQPEMGDLDFSGKADPMQEALAWMQKRFNTAFQLEKDKLLFEQYLIKIADDEHLFFGKYHHLMADGYGFVVWIQYMAQKYLSLVASDDVQFSYPSYKDELVKATESFNAAEYESDANYWKEKIQSKPQKALFKKRQHIPAADRRSITYILNLTVNQRKQLEEIQLLTKAGLQQLTIAALLIYLGKTTQQSEFVFGIPVHKRNSKRLRNTVGTFTGILPFKGVFDLEQKLADFIKDILASQRTDYRHQSYLVGDLTKHLKINSSEGYLSDIIINYEPLNFELNFGSEIHASIARLTNEDERNPLKVVWRDYNTEQPLQLHIHFSNEYFSQQEIELLAQRLIYIIEQFPAQLDSPLESINILPANENLVLRNFNHKNARYPTFKTIVDLFEEKVLLNPELKAVILDDESLTFKDLNERANQLAHYLLAKGVKKDTLVALCIDRSVEMIVSIFGILKAGGAYVPIDPDYPGERIQYLLQDSAASIIITSSQSSVKLPKNIASEIIELDINSQQINTCSSHNPGKNIQANNLAYVIYTSGSTGKPKGVMIEHKGVVNLALSQKDALRLTPGMRTLQFASIGFDASCYEIFNTLLSGGCLVLCRKEDLLSAEKFEEIITDNHVEVAVLPPSYQHSVIDYLGTLQTIVSAGEPLNETIGKSIQAKGIRLVNAYGPTENTVCVSLTDDPINENHTIVIGKPLANVQVYIVIGQSDLAPVGVTGEICVAGAQVARGYLNQPLLTAEKFVTNPFEENAVSYLYRTGDLGRWDADGNIEYLGRIDDQVKIRGHRIEPGEIETVLEQSEWVNQAVVLAKEDKDGNKRLVGYIVPQGPFHREAIIQYLSNKLPDYMVPATWLALDSLPITANGKIDRKALAELEIATSTNIEDQSPSNKTEEKLAEIWQDLLGLDKVGTHDNFFELGGDSIISIQLVSRARQLGFELEVGDIFTHQTIAALSNIIVQKSGTTGNKAEENELLAGECGLLPIQQWYLQKEQKNNSHYNQSVIVSIDKTVAEEVIADAVQQLMTYHDALRFTYSKEDTAWKQEYGSKTGKLFVEDARAEDPFLEEGFLSKIAAKYQSSLDILTGDLVRAVWIQTPASQDFNKLIIIIHHLTVDGVSWRILLDDLHFLINEAKEGKKAVLKNKTTSYRHFYEALEEYSKTPQLLSQQVYWRNLIQKYKALPTDFATTAAVKISNTSTKTITLGIDETRLLLQRVPKVYQTEINDILLGALGKTLCDWSHCKDIVVGLEGHGREPILPGLDTSHTVGWFTSLFPVLLTAESAEVEDWLISVKEQLRQLPDKGMGYGVLKYINKNEALQATQPWDVVFNYLGQLDNVTRNNTWLKEVKQLPGGFISEEHLVTEKLVINSMIEGGRLKLNWTYSRTQYKEETIENLAQQYIHSLQTIIANCVAKGDNYRLKTPSDFGLAGVISYPELTKFLKGSFNGKTRVQQIESLYPLSGLQQGILFHGLYDGVSGTYISQLSCKVKCVDIDVFKRSWNIVVKQHSILRSAFYYDSFSVPVQCVYSEVDIPVTLLDYTDKDANEQQLAIKKFENEDVKRGFDFNMPPLVRIALIQTSADDYTMLLTFHHILLDGWSIPVVMEEFLSTYELLLSGKQEPVLQVEDQYQEYIQYISSKDKEQQEDYWRNYLKGVQQSTLLPFIKATADRTKGLGENKVIDLQLDDSVTKLIQQFAQKNRITVNTIMQATWSVLLQKYTGRNDVVFGVTVSGRPDDLPHVERRVGLYINTLVLRAVVDEKQPLPVFLQRLQEDQIASRKYQYTSLSDIQKCSSVSGDLFDSILVFENYPISKVVLNKKRILGIDDVKIHDRTNYPLTIAVHSEEQINIHFNYNPFLLDDVFAKSISHHFETVLKHICDEEIIEISEVKILPPEEEKLLLTDFNNSTAHYPLDKTIIDLFEEQVITNHDLTALVFDNEKFTYDQINERANQVANYLRSIGVKEEVLVAVCIERSVEMIIAILGILKAGGAYVPVDPAYPAERIDYMIADCGTSVIIHSNATADKLQRNKTITRINLAAQSQEIDRFETVNLKIVIRPSQLAYVIYTSGSTGKPKGVMIEHKGIANLSLSQVDAFGLQPQVKTLQFASLGFDASASEIFTALLSGGVIVLPKKEDLLSAEEFKKFIINNEVDVATLPPSYQQIIIDNVGSIKTIISAGEPLNEVIGRQIQAQGIRLLNAYGPTENTVCVSLTDDPIKTDHTIVIGKPLPNVQVYILDEKSKATPLGIAGEICVAGAQVARGYLHRPQLTAEKFVANPFTSEAGSTLYKTGDLGRWLPNGNVEYLGRIDDQVKIRGYRVEPGEIENLLLQSELVSQAVILAKDDADGNKRLIAYTVVKGSFNKNALTAYLLAKLPEYMVPGIWINLDSLPVTANGKIDKKALPDPDLQEFLQAEFEAPRSQAEQRVANLWKELLKKDRIGVKDNFFELGGQSLLAIRLLSFIKKEFETEINIRDVFTYPTVESLAAFLDSKLQKTSVPSLGLQKRPLYIPLSYSQERLWFIHQLEGSVQYHAPAVIRLKGNLNISALRHAFKTLIDRHEVLRTVFLEKDGHPYQYIKHDDGCTFNLINRAAFKEDPEGLQQYIQQLIAAPFDLKKDDMLRADLIELSKQEFILVVVTHHIASDAWSLPIIVKEVAELYHSYIEDRNAELPVLTLQYADYAIWQRDYLKEEILQEKLDYWKNKLEGVLPLQLPSDYARPIVRSSRGSSAPFEIDNTLAEQLLELSRRQGTTLYMTLLAAFNVMLNRYSGQADIAVGGSVANRPQREIEGLVGFFVNTLAYRTEIESNLSFVDLLQQVRATTLEAYEHQEVPFEKVVEAVVKDRDASMSPIFQVMLVLVNTPKVPELKLGDVVLTQGTYKQATVKFDLTFFVTETADGLQGLVEFSTDLFAASTIARMTTHFTNLLQSVVKNPLQKVGLLPMLSATEEQQLLGLNKVEVAYPKDATIVSLFEEQTQKTPQATAVVYDGEELTYEALNAKANQLAHYLRQRGVKEDTLVPVYIERSQYLIVGIIGVMKAGAAYVPIDTDFPADRISYMIKDSGSPVVISSKESRSKLETAEPDTEIIEIDGAAFSEQPQINPKTELQPHHLAYVIYTSGSTGMPKGVMIEHRNLVDYVFGLNYKIQVEQAKSYALVSSIATDLGNTVIYSSLVFGGALHLFSKEQVSNIEYLHHYFQTQEIDCLKIVPSHWKALSLDEELLLPKKLLIFGGEALQSALVADIRPTGSNCKVVNHYGPTETTIGKLLHQTEADKTYNHTIPIGKPFSNTKVYVLSKELQLSPQGIPGQLYIAGDGVARGYLNNEELTQIKFIQNPFEAGRMYATGDLVRYLPDGNIEFIGRVDDQVKIRGYRVELGEIESILQQSELVSQAVVLAKDDKQGNKRLIGYIVPEDGWLDREALQSYLKEKLPEYMIPAQLVELESLPLTANGKVNRKALPDPEATEQSADKYTAPRNEAETRLTEIWQDVLEEEKIGIHDNFFELGGHSLLAVRLISAIRKEFAVEIPISHVFDYPTIALLAAELDVQSDAAVLPSIVAIQPRPERIPLSFSQERLWFIDRLEGSVQYHVPAVLRLKGHLNKEALAQALQAIVNRHEVLRTVILEKDGQPYQHIKEKDQWQLSFEDGSKYNDDSAALKQYCEELINKPFNLSADDMIRGQLIYLDDQHSLLVITLHHIASDGWSRSILVSELVQLYKDFDEKQGVTLSPLPLQFADYSIWQRNYLTEEILDKKLAYWKDRLDGITDLQLPTDFTRPPVQSARGAIKVLSIEKQLSQQLHFLSKQQGTTLFMTLLAAFKVLLYRYTGHEDIVVGGGIAGRTQQEVEQLIGFFVNMLAFRSEVKSNTLFTDLLQQIKETTLEAFANQEVPFEKIVDAIGHERDLSRNPLFQVTFILQNTPVVPTLKLGEVELLLQESEHNSTKFDLTISISENEAGLEVLAEYATDLFTEETIARMLGHYKQLLSAVVKEPGKKISELELLTKEEKDQILYNFNKRELSYDGSTSIVDLFEKQVLETPGKTAATFDDFRLTYKQLNERSNQLAYHLVDTGVKRETLVAICIERSLEMIVAILAVLKAGGAYVPIDPAYPRERIQYIIKDSAAPIVITKSSQTRSLEINSGVTMVDIEADLSNINELPVYNLSTTPAPSNLAYVIYTSGSTGQPKGAMVEHRSVVNLIHAQTAEFKIDSDERILLFSNYSFDASVEQIFLSLCNGASLFLFTEGLQLETLLFQKFLRDKKITHLHATPSFLSGIDPQSQSTLKRVIAGGDHCRKELADKWKNTVDFYNEYGPTETTVTAIEYLVSSNKERSNNLPIGKPLANVSVYILDEDHNISPVGIPGKLFIGGVQVCRGYLNRTELTAEKFISNHFNRSDNNRLYNTGDVARWLPDGNIEFLGRIDDQVKIRGYRIEMGEIENVLGECSLVTESVVIAKPADEDNLKLISYYVPDKKIVKERERDLYEKQVATWSTLYNEEYLASKIDECANPEFDIIGWIDSFTDQPIAEEQMRLWLKDIVDVIFAQKPENVLEIGCGTGLIYYQLAGKIKKYIGTDFSRSSINQIENWISKGLRNYGETELYLCAAHEIKLSDEQQVDTIIINSVAQYFPGQDYMTNVIENCVKVLKGKGRIIIGDVRDYRLLELFKERLSLDKFQHSASIKEFNWAVQQDVLKEEELCYSPDYFYELQNLLPEISHVNIQWKKGSFSNELSLYRYNVIIYVGGQPEVIKPDWQSWQDVNAFEQITESLKSGKPVIPIQDVPNYRLWKEKKLAETIAGKQAKVVGDLLKVIEAEDEESAAVADIISLAEQQGYNYKLLLDEDIFKVNLVLEREKSSDLILQPYKKNSNVIKGQLTNVPLFTDIALALQKEIKSILHQTLPAYMIPADFVAVSRLPITDNGKIDRPFLVQRRERGNVDKQNYQAPVTEVEKKLADIWKELLNIERIGIHDNFFELGGHSLLAIRVIAAIRDKWEVELMAKDIFQYNTISELSKYLEIQLNVYSIKDNTEEFEIVSL